MSVVVTPVEYYYWNNAEKLTWDSDVTWGNPVKKYDIDVIFNEYIKIIERSLNAEQKVFSSNVILSEHRGKGLEKLIAESTDFAVTYFDYISFLLNFVESIHIDSDVLKGYETDFRDNLSASESNTKKHGFSYHEQIALLDAFVRIAEFYRKLDQRLQLSSKNSTEKCKHFFSFLNVQDKSLKDENKTALEAISVGESYAKYAGFFRDFDEWAVITEKLAKAYGLSEVEAARVNSSILHKARAVISDICFSTNEIDVDSPPGYGPFKTFLPGDYTYQKAIFKTLIETTLTGKKALLDEYSIKVDLPDIQDMGTSSISDEPAKVKFNQRFFRIPEVTITMRAGSGAVPVPVITEVTREYFIVELKGVDGSLTSGTISWTALGC